MDEKILKISFHKVFTSTEQLDSIRSYSMAHLLCENSDPKSVNNEAFIIKSSVQDSIECSKLQPFDVSSWKESFDE